MPTIEITAEQARALARGENVTIAPAKPARGPRYRYLIITAVSKNVFEVITDQNVEVGCDVRLPYFNPPAERVWYGRMGRADVARSKRSLGGMRGTVVKVGEAR